MAQLRRIKVELSETLPQTDPDSGLVVTSRPVFGAEIELDPGEDGEAAAARLEEWVRWHFLRLALASYREHRRCLNRGIFKELQRLVEKHPEPPSLSQ